MPPPSNLSKPPRPAAEAIDSAPSRRNGAAGLGGRARQRWRRGRPLSAITTVTLIQAASHYYSSLEQVLCSMIVRHPVTILLSMPMTKKASKLMKTSQQSDPEGILVPPQGGHIAHLEFRRRLERDSDAREDFERQVREEHERRRREHQRILRSTFIPRIKPFVIMELLLSGFFHLDCLQSAQDAIFVGEEPDEVAGCVADSPTARAGRTRLQAAAAAATPPAPPS
ncbi:hypothetical protein EJB05_13969, partial [Eragrostis curvula]